ncbi:uncharacterized protein LOC8283263 isoform X2 [Ricinus communis]|uniref:uncharacterized protein LOC8283263 isoform X2 n=1 Tax=Ricinus communis TaxID=3988 RepID=UPI0007727BAD|nr:uncharacterized protein LOC8283263 isoform X2 [Ricinus communis]|eukprot:XP_002521835.2 uncharacterized protein LOC8283263 isoform X2 [Ricinus communis]
MALSSPSSSLLSPSSHLQISTKPGPRLHSISIQRLKGPSQYFEAHRSCFCGKLNKSFRNARLNISCAMNVAAGQSGDPEKLNVDHIIDKARNLWDTSPQPVKRFPWNRALENFIQLILDLVVAVVKYLCVPLLAVSSLSEMSYCAHHKKLSFVPLPLLIGIVVAGILKETALELSPLLKDAEVPWHLIAIAIFFSLIKLPGPYYPYWGRIFIPHFANGVLWRTIWSAFLWYRKPRKASQSMLKQDSVIGSNSGTNKN